jgi:hypothetical protein
MVLMFTVKGTVTEVIKPHHYNIKAHVCSNVQNNFTKAHVYSNVQDNFKHILKIKVTSSFYPFTHKYHEIRMFLDGTKFLKYKEKYDIKTFF